MTPAETGDMLTNCLTIERDAQNPRPAPGVCRIKVVFEPLKSVRCKVQLMITRASGGRWRYDLELLASQPDVDDVIKIQGTINRTTSISFRLTNQFDKEAPYQAYFSVESPPEFSVTPTVGLLDAYGSEGTNFVISFTPKVYGKLYQAKLIVETEEMQWSYQVLAHLPRYDPPHAAGKVDSWIPAEVDPDLYKTRQQPQNYMQQNLQSVRASGSILRSPVRASPNKNTTL